eukprot:SAG22_NODE_940_length_6402_cov_34.673172_3_plen_223_part_00
MEIGLPGCGCSRHCRRAPRSRRRLRTASRKGRLAATQGTSFSMLMLARSRNGCRAKVVGIARQPASNCWRHHQHGRSSCRDSSGSRQQGRAATKCSGWSWMTSLPGWRHRRSSISKSAPGPGLSARLRTKSRGQRRRLAVAALRSACESLAPVCRGRGTSRRPIRRGSCGANRHGRPRHQSCQMWSTRSSGPRQDGTLRWSLQRSWLGCSGRRASTASSGRA